MTDGLELSYMTRRGGWLTLCNLSQAEVERRLPLLKTPAIVRTRLGRICGEVWKHGRRWFWYVESEAAHE